MKRHFTLSALAVTAIAGIAIMAGGLTPAAAATSHELVAVNSAPSSQTSTFTNADCLAAVDQAIAGGNTAISTDVCVRTETITASAAETVTVSDLAEAKRSLPAAEYKSLSAAVAAGAVQRKSYHHVIINVTDQENQQGYFYFNQSRAWVTSTYLGYTGSHICIIDYAVGITVSVNSCSESGSTSRRTVTQAYNFNLGGIGWSEGYNMYLTATGGITT